MCVCCGKSPYFISSQVELKLTICRSLVANLSAANCYKTEHLKRPENWALGTHFSSTFVLFSFTVYFVAICYKISDLNANLLSNSGAGKILLYCWIFLDGVP